MPYLTNRISVNSEHDLVNVRLLSICPPDALRPYYQEGYLAGTDEITTQYESKDELDFNNRLIAKFELQKGQEFWSNGFASIPKTVLYPDDDIVHNVCSQISVELGTEVEPGNLGKFLQEWVDLESIILSMARRYSKKVYSFHEATNILYRKKLLPTDITKQLDSLRYTRNLTVHKPREVNPQDLTDALEKITLLKRTIDNIERNNN